MSKPRETRRLFYAIDPFCESFEKALQEENAPRIEDVLEKAPAEVRPLLFHHLLALEWENRAKTSPMDLAVARADYRQRFPAYHAVTDQVLGLDSGNGTPQTAPRNRPARPPRRTLGPYTLLKPLGHGGMGEVFLGQHEGLRRLAAIKMMRTEVTAAPELVARFRTEAEAVARLKHPNIVQVFDVGEEAGIPYLALEYLGGGTLAQSLDGTPWPSAKAAGLVKALAQGVAAAHRAGVIHRDLKPGNILMEEEKQADQKDAFATPKIADFGLAKILEGVREPTESGLFIGTPSYCAPEQAAGTSRDVGPLADIYSLGVILYELLTGRPPFRGATIAETLSQVLHQAPVAPRILNPSIDRDLETICLKCLEKAPSRRYTSAVHLAEDLHRFLEGRPILARPISMTGHWIRWARRNPVLAAALVFLGLFLVLTTGAALFAAERFRNQAVLESQLRTEAEQAQDKTRSNLYYSRMFMAGRAAESPSGILRIRELVQEWLPQAGKRDLRGWEWRHFRSLGAEENCLVASDRHGCALAWSPDGTRLVVGQDSRTLMLDPRLGTNLGEIEATGRRVWSVCWSPDGQRLATLDGRDILILDPNSFRCLNRLPVDPEVHTLDWHPDGKRLYFLQENNVVRSWDTSVTPQVGAVTGFKAHGGTHGSLLSPDGRLMALPGWDPFTIVVVETHSGKEIHRFREHETHWVTVAWRGDGSRLAAASDSGVIAVWDVRSGKQIWSHSRDGSYVPALAWSPDGRRLAWGNWTYAVHVWDLENNEEIAHLRGHERAVQAVCWSPDGRKLASTGDDGLILLWDLKQPPAFWTRDLHAQMVRPRYLTVAWSRDGARLATSTQKRGTVLWNSQRGERLGHLEGVYPVWDPDDATLALVSGESVVLYGGMGQGKEATFEVPGQPKSLAWNPRRRQLAIRAADRIWLWDRTQDAPTRLRGKPVARGEIPWFPTSNLAWHPKGEWLAFGEFRGDRWTVVVLNVATGAVVKEWDMGGAAIEAVAWSADGQFLASGGEDPTIRIRDMRTGEVTQQLQGHNFRVLSLAWHPDGTRMASASEDGSVRIWDAHSGDLAFQADLDCMTRSVAWSDDGIRLATLGADGLLRVWDATRGYRE